MKTCNCKREERANTARLLAAGIAVPAEVGSSSVLAPDITVEPCNVLQTKAFSFRSRIEYVFHVRITNRSYARLQMLGIDCRLELEDPNFTWIAPPCPPNRGVYRLPSGREFLMNQVLNHYKGERVHQPGERVEGFLLALSLSGPISAYYLHGSRFSVLMTVTDQYRRPHFSTFEVEVDRTATIKWPSLTRVGKGVFERSPEAAGKVAKDRLIGVAVEEQGNGTRSVGSHKVRPSRPAAKGSGFDLPGGSSHQRAGDSSPALSG